MWKFRQKSSALLCWEIIIYDAEGKTSLIINSLPKYTPRALCDMNCEFSHRLEAFTRCWEESGGSELLRMTDPAPAFWVHPSLVSRATVALVLLTTHSLRRIEIVWGSDEVWGWRLGGVWGWGKVVVMFGVTSVVVITFINVVINLTLRLKLWYNIIPNIIFE